MLDAALAKLQRVPLQPTVGVDLLARRQAHGAAQRHLRQWQRVGPSLRVEGLPNDGCVRSRRRTTRGTFQRHGTVSCKRRNKKEEGGGATYE